MKKLLLITFLFLIIPHAKADMDYICEVDFNDAILFISENCERDNILLLEEVPRKYLINNITYWCRQDRQINYLYTYDRDGESLYDLSCVLYANSARRSIYNSR